MDKRKLGRVKIMRSEEGTPGSHLVLKFAGQGSDNFFLKPLPFQDTIKYK